MDTKKPKTYNLRKSVWTEINKRALADNRKDSDWLDLFLSDKLCTGASVTKALISEPKKKSVKFIPPLSYEVAQYCHERNNKVDPQSFIDHYEANGWMRGKTKIKDWKACVRTWEQKSNGKTTNNYDGAI